MDSRCHSFGREGGMWPRKRVLLSRQLAALHMKHPVKAGNTRVPHEMQVQREEPVAITYKTHTTSTKMIQRSLRHRVWGRPVEY